MTYLALRDCCAGIVDAGLLGVLRLTDATVHRVALLARQLLRVPDVLPDEVNKSLEFLMHSIDPLYMP